MLVFVYTVRVEELGPPADNVTVLTLNERDGALDGAGERPAVIDGDPANRF